MKKTILAVLLVCLTATLAWGQLGVSTITGRVTDETGAVVPGAAVRIMNTATNFSYTSETNSEGIYRVPSLQPGPYRVEVEAPGFKRFLHDNLDLRAGATLAVNPSLEVGTLTEQIEVTAETPLLETETSVVGASVTGEIMYKLPNYQRYVASVMNLVPGISSGGYAYGGGLGNYRVAGQRSSALGAFDDGVPTNDQLSGTGYVKPLLNSVEDIKVLTTAIPAEYGHSAGGVLDVVKKTGTNQFHGIASMYGRNRIMQHRLFFDRERTTQATPSNPNGTASIFFLPDFNVSGPIVRNKTFFVVGYQHLIEKKTAQAFGRVPTADMLGGDFSFGGIGNPIFDPASTSLVNGAWVRTPFQNNVIPVNRFNPVAQAILGQNPWTQPNRPAQPNAEGPTDNLQYNELALVFFHDYNVRIDQQFSSNFKMFGSWTANSNDGLSRHPRNVIVRDFDAADGNLTPDRNQNYSLGKTWILNPTMIWDTRVGYNRRFQERTVDSQGQGWPSRLGIPNVDDSLMPSFGSGNQFLPETTYGLNVRGGFRRVHETLSLRSDMTKIRGTHSFKWGYEILKFRLNAYQTDTPSGEFLFNDMTADLQPGGQPVPRTGNTFAGFLLGHVRQATFTQELAGWHPTSNIQSFYLQDDWKATPTLTFNLGMRYSNESQFNTKYGNHSNFDPTAIDPLSGLPGAIVHSGQALTGRDHNNFQPRVGMAWQFQPKWVARLGFAVNTIDIKFPTLRGNFEEYTATAVHARAPGDPRPIYEINQIPSAPVFPVLADGTSPFQGTNFAGRNVEWWDPNLRNPYAMNWNISLQRELGRNYLLETSYQGSSGVGLSERWQYNTFPMDFGANDPAFRTQVFNAPQNFRPFPQFGNVMQRCNCGHSSYHGGTVRLEKRYSDSGLTFMTFYTWSKAINSHDDDNAGGGVDPLRNRGLEKSLAGYHREHRYVGTILYELPVGQGRKWLNRGGWLNHLLGGYEIAWIQTMETGNPYNITYAGNPANQWPTFVGDRRPNAVLPNPRLRDNYREEVARSPDRFSEVGIAPVIDADFFGYPGAFTPGTLGRNVVIGPGLLWSQVSAQKNITITERVRMQIRWDMQNALKTYNFNPPTNSWNSQALNTFGKVRADPRTASVGGQPLMNLTVALMF